MGNSQTKEARQQGLTSSSRLAGTQSNTSAGSASAIERGSDQQPSDRPALLSYPSSGRRGSRPDLSFLGIGSNNERDVSNLEGRRETKQEREARKLEKERVARLKERERSMKEEHIDGGYLVTQGVYVGTEDYNKAIVRQLMAGFSFPQGPVCLLTSLADRAATCTILERPQRIFRVVGGASACGCRSRHAYSTRRSRPSRT